MGSNVLGEKGESETEFAQCNPNLYIGSDD